MSTPRKTIARSIALLWLAATTATQAALSPLPGAHAHNDYQHSRPLADALSHGFWSVEADIWLTNGLLLVAHDFDKATPERTLQKLYLDPLRAFVKTNGLIRPRSLTLLIDLKSEGEATYAALRGVLRDYSDILTRFDAQGIHSNAVTVIVSGDRPLATMRAETMRLAAVDGRLADLAGNPPVGFMPLVSDNWTKHFQWKGQGDMPEADRAKLRSLVVQTHDQGRWLRLWATPDQPACWKELRAAGVDLINTDRLAELEKFLRQ